MAQAQPIVLCSLDHWPPYVTKADISTRIVNRVMNIADIEFVRKPAPWNRALEDTRNGHCDALSEAYLNEDRKKWAIFSESYAPVPMTLFSRKQDNISYQKVSDLHPYQIGMIRGASISTDFHADKALQLTPITDISQGIKMLIGARIDLFVSGEAAIQETLKQLAPSKQGLITPIYPPLKLNRLHIAFNRGKPDAYQLAQRFNTALRSFKASEEYRDLLTSSGLKQQY